MSETTTCRSEVKEMLGACYHCKHRGTLAGDAHSRCGHPCLGQTDPNQFGMLIDLMSGKYTEAVDTLAISADPHGVKSGWFMWPANFDPVWLKHCAGFETEDGLNWEQHCETKAGEEDG